METLQEKLQGKVDEKKGLERCLWKRISGKGVTAVDRNSCELGPLSANPLTCSTLTCHETCTRVVFLEGSNNPFLNGIFFSSELSSEQEIDENKIFQ